MFLYQNQPFNELTQVSRKQQFQLSIFAISFLRIFSEIIVKPVN